MCPDIIFSFFPFRDTTSVLLKLTTIGNSLFTLLVDKFKQFAAVLLGFFWEVEGGHQYVRFHFAGIFHLIYGSVYTVIKSYIASINIKTSTS